MKAIILKKMMPAAVFVLAISGAFLTMSMQSDANTKVSDDLVVGFPITLTPCSVQIVCSDEGTEVCRVSYPGGAQAFGRPEEGGMSCPETVFKP
ncbi:DUF6520 family protein [Flavobacterium sp. F-65]|uniref:DUF6520 family protein n=1 Tax=Flavobacterium pisciphilum TaxID=2893755 RepID=A0ABS8MZK3_9FLAO|nr:DUF6520 family protein [Flavobacterium sp. F-65]MCC9073532.1 DUF6520 family protein [Flavobacterium sp. F-65]